MEPVSTIPEVEMPGSTNTIGKCFNLGNEVNENGKGYGYSFYYN